MTSRPVRLGLLIASLALLVACDHYSAAEGEPAPSLAPGPSPFVAAQRDPCFTPDPPSPITVSVVHRADGTCWPISKELVYRCDPSMPAVAEVDVGQGVRRFLGGSYAVPVALSATALSEGVTPFGELFLDAGDPSFLWVRSDGVTERWLALPNRAKLADPPTAQMIGDSILDGGQTDVAAGLPDWTVSIDALIGRGSSGAAGVAEALPSPAADVVVIEIGVNDPEAALTTANAQRVITAQGGARLLVWLTAHGPEPQVPEINQAIWDAMGPLSNGAVLDWDRLVPLDALSSDGIHPDVGQQGALASIVDPYLQGWLDAVEGGGATACQGSIRSNA